MAPPQITYIYNSIYIAENEMLARSVGGLISKINYLLGRIYRWAGPGRVTKLIEG